MSIPGFDEFELDIEKAFRRDLPPFLETVDAAPLATENVLAIPAKKNGIYLLLERDVVRYVGKTDARAGFHNRLTRHAFHLHHRKNLDPGVINFKAIAIPVFKNADLEDMLIQHYGAKWNNSGFGSNDPGKERDTQLPAIFDREYPVDVNIALDCISTGPIACKDLLNKLTAELPYTFRFERKAQQSELDTIINIPRSQMTMSELLKLIVNSLPSDKWQATVLYGRVILYPEQNNYKHFQEVIVKT